VEQAGGDVVQYRGEIMPLVHVGRMLRGRSVGNGRDGKPRPPRPKTSGASGRDERLPVVVCAHEGRHVGLVVGHILDIVEVTITARSNAARPGVMYTAVVQDRVTEFLDVAALIANAAPALARATITTAGS
jgi:two-component system chemotaxis sensor kinase CheA